MTVFCAAAVLFLYAVDIDYFAYSITFMNALLITFAGLLSQVSVQ
jgi:hypothetical protein